MTGLSQAQCECIKIYLYKKQLLGNHYFEQSAPLHTYIKDRIIDDFPHISRYARILEVGSVNCFVFSQQEYPHWYGIDNFYGNSRINFKENKCFGYRYSNKNIFQGRYENLTQVLMNHVAQFDLVVGYHSFEHVFQPITALREVYNVLRPGGIFVLFVTDGYSDDPSTKDSSHTLCLVPDMIHDFFAAAGGFSELKIEPFRPNVDLYISAVKIACL